MLGFKDWDSDRDGWAKSLGVSREAIDVYATSDVIDLHVDSFLWTRMLRYDLTKAHGHGAFGARLYSQVDLPRIREARITGAIWSITTNPYRSAAARKRIFFENLARFSAIFESVKDDVAIVRDAGEYDAARRAGKHAAFVGIQGGNALDFDDDALESIPARLLVRVTLVHLSSSSFGTTSAPTGSRKGEGITRRGEEFVRRLDEKRIFVDLAHASRATFFDAVRAHDRSLPLIVTHTGIAGVHPHWRNLEDDQVRAIADSGGTIGVMYHAGFLGGAQASRVVDHLAHIVDVAGEDFASLGSDWDGLISPPRDMPTCLELPRLAQRMLDRGWSAERIQKILGKNFVRALRQLRGGS